ncbi:HAD hydrolase family protein [Georgenia sp. Z1491]|uniref:HAD hydrolase family protein n=1 Tax=Georgenia sp. Z1491 TaxID=3416707 RepID=UPI003CEB46A4
MTDSKIVFLDVDGTYAHQGEVPPGHARAVEAARAAGHRVLLCTGRSKAMLPERIVAAGFDGIVAMAGAYVEVGREVVADRRFPADLGDRLVDVLESHDVVFVLETPRALLGTPRAEAAIRAEVARHESSDDGSAHAGPSDILAALSVSDELRGRPFAKAVVVESAVPNTRLAREAGDGVLSLEASVPGLHPSSGELYLADMHKAVGMLAALEHLGADVADSIAFGDGMNDLEMLRAAGLGVAIEGADPRVIDAADRTAAGPEVEGLVAAFEELGLLGR